MSSDWISPRERQRAGAPPQRGRVTGMRDRFEAPEAQQESRHQTPQRGKISALRKKFEHSSSAAGGSGAPSHQHGNRSEAGSEQPYHDETEYVSMLRTIVEHHQEDVATLQNEIQELEELVDDLSSDRLSSSGGSSGRFTQPDMGGPSTSRYGTYTKDSHAGFEWNYEDYYDSEDSEGSDLPSGVSGGELEDSVFYPGVSPRGFKQQEPLTAARFEMAKHGRPHSQPTDILNRPDYIKKRQEKSEPTRKKKENYVYPFRQKDRRDTYTVEPTRNATYTARQGTHESSPQESSHRESNLSQDSYSSSPHRSRHSSGYRASSPHSSESSHGPPRPQQRRRRRALPNIDDPQSASTASDPSRSDLNEARFLSGISSTSDDTSKQRHTSDPHSTRSSAPQEFDPEQQLETETMESGSTEEESGRRGGVGHFVSDIEEFLGTRKLEPKPNTPYARLEALEDQLREANRQAGSWSDSYSGTDHTHSSQPSHDPDGSVFDIPEDEYYSDADRTHSSQQERSQSSQDPDGSAFDVHEDANESGSYRSYGAPSPGSYRAPSPNMLGRQWAPGDLNEMLRRMQASPQQGSSRGSPENVQQQAPVEGLNRRWGASDLAAALGRTQGEAAEDSAQSSHRSHSSQGGAHSPVPQSGTPQHPPPEMLNRRWRPEDLAAQFSRMQDESRHREGQTSRPHEERHSAQSSNRSHSRQEEDSPSSNSSMGRREQQENLDDAFIGSTEEERYSTGSSNRSHSRQEDDVHSSRLSSSMGNRRQPANLNETFTRSPDDEMGRRRQPANLNETFTRSPDEETGRRRQPANLNETFTRSPDEERGRRRQPANLNETYTRSPNEERHSAGSSNRSYPRQEDKHSPRTESGRQPQDLNRRWGPDDFNQQFERQPQDLNRRWGPADFNQQFERQPQGPGDFNQSRSSSASSEAWDAGCY